MAPGTDSSRDEGPGSDRLPAALTILLAAGALLPVWPVSLLPLRDLSSQLPPSIS